MYFICFCLFYFCNKFIFLNVIKVFVRDRLEKEQFFSIDSLRGIVLNNFEYVSIQKCIFFLKKNKKCKIKIFLKVCSFQDKIFI